MDITKNEIVKINRGILGEWARSNPTETISIGFDTKRLSEVLTFVDEQDSFLMKAAYLMGAMAWAQPFTDGNKRTSFTCADTLLKLNGYELKLEKRTDIDYLISLLREVQEERSSLNEDTMAKIVLYVAKRIRKL